MSASPPKTRGTLYLVPAPLDFGCDVQMPLQDSLPEATLLTAARLTHWVCENAKSEGLGISLLDAIDSDDPTALIGLPLIRTCRMLRAAGLVLP